MARLSGDYSPDDLVRAFQGNFSCQSVTRNSRGTPLPESERHIRLEYYFIRAEIYNDRIAIYKSDSTDWSQKLTKIGELPFRSSKE